MVVVWFFNFQKPLTPTLIKGCQVILLNSMVAKSQIYVICFQRKFAILFSLIKDKWHHTQTNSGHILLFIIPVTFRNGCLISIINIITKWGFFSYNYTDILSEVSECKPLPEHILHNGIFFLNKPISSHVLFLSLLSPLN